MELQRARVTGKSALMDRRPLEPPPMVELELSEVLNVESFQEAQTDIADPGELCFGMVCWADLFRLDSANDPPNPYASTVIEDVDGQSEYPSITAGNGDSGYCTPFATYWYGSPGEFDANDVPLRRFNDDIYDLHYCADILHDGSWKTEWMFYNTKEIPGLQPFISFAKAVV
ncbi:hypothetical protein K474DRAFT_1709172 [Panus rudis PR-1116 ss-1]|nr:hypothetical protein K474DRAFT_1709172 [Panus rudis PR-1116 ss-1]